MSNYDDDEDSFYRIERESLYDRPDSGNSSSLLTFEALQIHNATRAKKADTQNDSGLVRKNSSNLDEVLQYKDPKQFQETQFQRENSGTPTGLSQRRPSVINVQKSPLPHLSLSHSQQQSLQIQQHTRPRATSYAPSPDILLDDSLRHSLDEQQYSLENYAAQRRPSTIQDGQQISRSLSTSDSNSRVAQLRRGSESIQRTNSGAVPIQQQQMRRASATFDSADPHLDEALRRSLDDHSRSQQSEHVHPQCGSRGDRESQSRRGSCDSGTQFHMNLNSTPTGGSYAPAPSYRGTPGSSPHVSSPISDGSMMVHALTSQQIVAARVRAFNLVSKANGGSPIASSPSGPMYGSCSPTVVLPIRPPSPTGSTGSGHRPVFYREGSDTLIQQALSREGSYERQQHSQNGLSPPNRQVLERQSCSRMWPEVASAVYPQEPEYTPDTSLERENSGGRPSFDLRIQIPEAFQEQRPEGVYDSSPVHRERRPSYAPQPQHQQQYQEQQQGRERRPSYAPQHESIPREREDLSVRRPSYAPPQRRPSQYQQAQSEPLYEEEGMYQLEDVSPRYSQSHHSQHNSPAPQSPLMSMVQTQRRPSQYQAPLPQDVIYDEEPMYQLDTEYGGSPRYADEYHSPSQQPQGYHSASPGGGRVRCDSFSAPQGGGQYSPPPPISHHQQQQQQQMYQDGSSPRGGGHYPQQPLPVQEDPRLRHSPHYGDSRHVSRDYSDGHTSLDRQSFDTRGAALSRSRTDSYSQLPVRPLSNNTDSDVTRHRSVSSTPRNNLSDEHMSVLSYTHSGGGGGGGSAAVSPHHAHHNSSGSIKTSTVKTAASWQCAICTLVNVATYLVCEACGTTKNAVVAAN